MKVKILVVLLLCILGSTKASFSSAINSAQQGMRRARCQAVAQSNFNGQFQSYCKVGRINVIALNVGGGFFGLPSGQHLLFSGNVLRTSDVTFVTEQNGYGDITAKFNGVVLQCSGFGGMKRKTCVIPRAQRPWSGTIIVTVFGRFGHNPSTRYVMSGTPVCKTSGFEGANCNIDINECEKYKDKRLCQWNKGCVNTRGSYRCKCPPGYKVSPSNFRYCVAERPEIYSKSVTRTIMSGTTTVLPCRHKVQPSAVVQWKVGSRVIAIKRANGVIQTVNNTKLTLRRDGDLVIKSVLYNDAGDFYCVVVNHGIAAHVKHTLKVESIPLMDLDHLVSGKHIKKHAYRRGDKVTIDCKVVAMPVPVISWFKNSQPLQTTHRLKVTQMKIKNFPLKIKGAFQSRLEISGVKTSDAGTYTCKARNKHGTNSRAIAVKVT